MATTGTLAITAITLMIATLALAHDPGITIQTSYDDFGNLTITCNPGGLKESGISCNDHANSTIARVILNDSNDKVRATILELKDEYGRSESEAANFPAHDFNFTGILGKAKNGKITAACVFNYVEQHGFSCFNNDNRTTEATEELDLKCLDDSDCAPDMLCEGKKCIENHVPTAAFNVSPSGNVKLATPLEMNGAIDANGGILDTYEWSCEYTTANPGFQPPIKATASMITGKCPGYTTPGTHTIALRAKNKVDSTGKILEVLAKQQVKVDEAKTVVFSVGDVARAEANCSEMFCDSTTLLVTMNRITVGLKDEYASTANPSSKGWSGNSKTLSGLPLLLMTDNLNDNTVKAFNEYNEARKSNASMVGLPELVDPAKTPQTVFGPRDCNAGADSCVAVNYPGSAIACGTYSMDVTARVDAATGKVKADFTLKKSSLPAPACEYAYLHMPLDAPLVNAWVNKYIETDPDNGLRIDTNLDLSLVGFTAPAGSGGVPMPLHLTDSPIGSDRNLAMRSSGTDVRVTKPSDELYEFTVNGMSVRIPARQPSLAEVAGASFPAKLAGWIGTPAAATWLRKVPPYEVGDSVTSSGFNLHGFKPDSSRQVEASKTGTSGACNLYSNPSGSAIFKAGYFSETHFCSDPRVTLNVLAGGSVLNYFTDLYDALAGCNRQPGACGPDELSGLMAMDVASDGDKTFVGYNLPECARNSAITGGCEYP